MRKRKSKAVQSVERAAIVLKALIQAGDEVGVSALSRVVKLPVSTTYRLLTTMERHDLVQQNPATGRYHVGPLAANAVVPEPNYRVLEQVSVPYMERLRDRVGEDVVLGVASRGRSQMVRVVLGNGPAKIDVHIGSAIPMHCCGRGKVLLAYMPEEQRTLILRGFGLPRLTSKTITDLTLLESELERIREEGVAINDEEYLPGTRAMAAPVRDATGNVVAAVGVRGLASVLTDERLRELKAPVRETAEDISRALGATSVAPNLAGGA